MTEKEIVQALRYCSDLNPATCNQCKYLEEEHCVSELTGTAAALIGHLLVENAALREKVPQWISVRDRLPKPETRVIATDGVTAGEAYMEQSGEWKRYDRPLRWFTVTERDATHWMPFPEAPKEEET